MRSSNTSRVHPLRRRFLGIGSVLTVAAMLGGARLARADSSAPPRGKASALPRRTRFSAIKEIDAGPLRIGYAEEGPPDGAPVLLLHGWPYDIHTYLDAAGLLAARGFRVIVPYLRGYGTTRFRDASTARTAQQTALAADAIALLDALHIERAVVAGCDWGARTANIVAALWPERCKALVSVSGYLIGSRDKGKAPLTPRAEHAWWYQFYFATERGRAGYAANTREFARLIWQLASPRWTFDDATFDRTATAFGNPDHVDIVIHNYRWRLGLAEGDPEYAKLEEALARLPDITVPTVTLEGDANGAPHPDAKDYARKFVGKYAHRVVRGGVGHNLPQEAPAAFVAAVIAAAKL